MPADSNFEPVPGQGPFLENTGPVLTDTESLVFGLQTSERHANHRGTVQGGLLTTLADYALGRAIEADADDDHARATVSLSIDFLKPVKPGDWVVSATNVDRVGGTLAFADCSLTVDGDEVVRARAVFAVVD